MKINNSCSLSSEERHIKYIVVLTPQKNSANTLFSSSFSFCSCFLAHLFSFPRLSLCFSFLSLDLKSLVILPRLSESCSVLQSVLLWWERKVGRHNTNIAGRRLWFSGSESHYAYVRRRRFSLCRRLLLSLPCTVLCCVEPTVLMVVCGSVLWQDAEPI